MLTVRMLPPTAVAQQTINVKGRTYTGRPGEVRDVPDMDADVLANNGWTRAALSGPTTSRPLATTLSPPYTATPGFLYFDTTLGAPVIFDGARWRTFAGAAA
jgi:hypothetical protein